MHATGAKRPTFPIVLVGVRVFGAMPGTNIGYETDAVIFGDGVEFGGFFFVGLEAVDFVFGAEGEGDCGWEFGRGDGGVVVVVVVVVEW